MTRFRAAAALACVLFVAGVRFVSADVRSDQKTLVKFEGVIGRMVNLFGGKGAREGIQTTVMVKGNRKATLNDSTGQIVDLDEEKIYDLDLRRKTYKVTTFAELRRQLEEARRKMEEEARKAQQEARNEPKPEPERTQQDPQVEVDFDLKETGQRRTINGFDTHQVVMTITIREKGKTLDESGGLVLTADNWLGPRNPAMNEVAEFDLRYAKQFQSAMLSGASAQDMAAAMAMYPKMKDALERMRTESVKLDGTGVLTVVTVDAAKSAAQMAEEAKSTDSGSRSGSAPPPSSVGGLLGGLARRAARKDEPPAAPKQRLTVMTTTNELLKVTTDVSAAELAIPAGFKENK